MYYKILAALLSVPVYTILAANTIVSTGQYDSHRTGTNLNEKTLKVNNIDTHSFGKTGSYTVDGEVYAQPLYLSGQKISKKGGDTNVLYVATMHNSIYAFDADSPGSAPLWMVTLAPSVPAGLAGGVCPHNLESGPELGILSTPVIDVVTGTLYAVYATPAGPDSFAHYIAALDISNGQHRLGSPNLISASVPGNGYDSVNGRVSLNHATYIQRPALTLANGSVYAGFASCGPDPDPYHGWVIGYLALDVALQTSAYNSTPNGSEGGIWQSGRGIATDDLGNLYVSTGNGTNSATDFSDSVIKLGITGQPTGVFTDPKAAILTQFDLDLSSSGPMYLGSSGLLVAGGKEGVIHVLNPFLMASLTNNAGALIQSFQATTACGTFVRSGCYQLHSIAFWDTPSNPLLYVWGVNDTLRAYRLSGGKFNTTPDSQGTESTIFPGGSLALSANGKDVASGVLWAVTMDGVLHAFQGTNVANELYNSNLNAARDALGDATHFAVPTIADGKVFVPTRDNRVQVYGLLGK
jgi:hypothetical protein